MPTVFSRSVGLMLRTSVFKSTDSHSPFEKGGLGGV